MGSRLGRLFSSSLFLALVMSGCSSTDGEGLLVRGVETIQAAVIQIVPAFSSEPNLGRPLAAATSEEMFVTQQAVSALDPTESPGNRCPDAEGRVLQSSYPAILSGDPIPVIVYLPPCYDPYLQVYPVLFLLHGKPQDQRHWMLLGIDKLVDQGIQERAWPPFVMVMPQQPEPLFTDSDGGPGTLEQEFMQGLIPFILDRYAITGDGTQWGIAGISRGGVWALEIGIQNPDQFHAVAALSPALNVNRARPLYDPLVMFTEDRAIPAKIFLGAGELDSARAKTWELAEILADQGTDSRYLEVQGSHESATWIRIIPEMLSFITSDW